MKVNSMKKLPKIFFSISLLLFILINGKEVKALTDEEFFNLYTNAGYSEKITLRSIGVVYISKRVYEEHNYFLYQPIGGYTDRLLNTKSIDKNKQYEYLGFRLDGLKVMNSKYINSVPTSETFPIGRIFNILEEAEASWYDRKNSPYINTILITPMRYGAEPWNKEIMIHKGQNITPLWQGWGNHTRTLWLQTPLTINSNSNFFTRHSDYVYYANFYQDKEDLKKDTEIETKIEVFNTSGELSNILQVGRDKGDITFAVKVTTKVIGNEVKATDIKKITSSVTQIAGAPVTDSKASTSQNSKLVHSTTYTVTKPLEELGKSFVVKGNGNFTTMFSDTPLSADCETTVTVKTEEAQALVAIKDGDTFTNSDGVIFYLGQTGQVEGIFENQCEAQNLPVQYYSWQVDGTEAQTTGGKGEQYRKVFTKPGSYTLTLSMFINSAPLSDTIQFFVKESKDDVSLTEDKSITPTATIGSNKLNEELFDVTKGIPTTENLYANVMTGNYLIKNYSTELKTGTKAHTITVKKPYTITWETERYRWVEERYKKDHKCADKDGDGEDDYCKGHTRDVKEYYWDSDSKEITVSDNYTVTRAYAYYDLQHLEAYKIKNATLYNEALPTKSVILTPGKGYQPISFTIDDLTGEEHLLDPQWVIDNPSMTITLPSGTYDCGRSGYYEPSPGSDWQDKAESAVGEIRVRNDGLKIGKDIILDASSWELGNTAEPVDLPPIPMISSKTLYKEGLQIKKELSNGLKTSSGSIVYERYIELNPKDSKETTVSIKGTDINNVLVHTPVVMEPKYNKVKNEKDFD